MSWYPRSCPVCNGDLYDDPIDTSDVSCMMCARSFPARDVLSVQRMQQVRARSTAEVTTELEQAA